MVIKQLLKQLYRQHIVLTLNNGKLKIQCPEGAMNSETLAKIKQHKDQIMVYLDSQKNEAKTLLGVADIVKQTPSNQPVAASFAQQRLWFIDQLQGSSSEYNMASALHIEGAFDAVIAEMAITEIIARHQVLRTHFVMVDEQVCQALMPSWQFRLNQVDLRTIEPAQQRNKVEELIRQDSLNSFDLSKDLMVRASYLILADTDRQHKGVLLFNIHHIACDGWSMGVLLKEFVTLYQAFAEKKASPLTPLALQYSDYALWQRQWLSDEVLQQQLAYWRTQLADVPSVHGLLLDEPRPAERNPIGGRVIARLGNAHAQKLKALAQRRNMTLFMLLHGALALVLSRHSQSHDIVVGTSVANRTQLSVEPLIGFFVNTLVLRVSTDQLSLAEYFTHVRDVHLAAQSHQDVPFEQLVEHCQVARSTAHSPLFQIMFGMNTNQSSDLTIADIVFKPLHSDEVLTKFDLDIDAGLTPDGIEFAWTYDCAIFNRESIETLSAHLNCLLQSIAVLDINAFEKYDQTCLSMLSHGEQLYLTETLNQTQMHWPQERLVHQLFEAQVARHGNNIALVQHHPQQGVVRLSYQTLNQKANRLAHKLIEDGVAQGALVGIWLERSVESVVAMLAILKAGGAYVPLDTEHPWGRIEFLIKDTGLKHLVVASRNEPLAALENEVTLYPLTEPAFKAHISGYRADNPEISVINAAQAPVYAIYTSGSTGQPKGAMLSHDNLANLLYWYIEQYRFSCDSATLIVSAMAFDLTQKNIFAPLCVGGKVCLYGGNHLDGTDVRALICAEQISHLNCAPSAIYLISDHGKVWPELSWILLGGEPIDGAFVQRWHDTRGQKPSLVNMYGPTECTDIACHFTLNEAYWARYHKVAIGSANANVKLLVLDSMQRLAPIGAIGELYIAGKGVGLGYINNEALNRQKFVTVTLENGSAMRCYRTGDLVRYVPWQQSHVLEFIARIDDQVKVRGYRIELGEIQSLLSAHPQVASSFVMVQQDEGQAKRLVAYVVAMTKGDNETLFAVLKSYLQANLPQYMVPAVFMAVDTLPLNANGKVDKKALPQPQPQDVQGQYVAPQTPKETLLVKIWASALKLDESTLSTEANFFALGGDSILSVQVASKAARAGLYFSIKDLFDAQTIRQLAALAKQGAGVIAEQAPVTGSLTLLPIQRQFFTDETELHHYNQAVMLTTAPGFDAKALRAIVAKLLAHHDALRLCFSAIDGQWQAEHLPLGDALVRAAVQWQQLDNLDPQNLLDSANQAQRSLSPQKGQLLKAIGYSDTQADQPGRLLLVIHHLVVDGISWRILLEDCETLYGQWLAQQPLQLPDKSSSLQQWGAFLHEFSQTDAVAEQCRYWQDSLAVEVPLLRESAQAVSDSDGAVGVLAQQASFELEAKQTELLLGRCNSAYRTTINELLLAGLLLAMHRRVGVVAMRIDLEGHGREALSEQLDLGRTVGWFSSIYPLTLTIESADIDDLIVAVKEQYRQVPDNGIGYGLLKFLAEEPQLQQQPSSELVFNYLGQFDQLCEQDNFFKPAQEPSGDSKSRGRKPLNPLSLNGFVAQQRLGFVLGFNGNVYDVDVMQALMDEYANALGDIIEHCCQCRFGRFSLSDFPLAEASDEQLKQWLGSQGPQIADLYPATGMQQGLLFHGLIEQGGYVNQTLITFEDLNVAAFKQAWQQVIARHVIFRTAFVGLDSGNAHQLVYSDVLLNWQHVDLSELSAKRRDERIAEIRSTDKRQSFELTDAPLMRMQLLHIGDGVDQLLWSHHHALLDGWCLPMVLQEVFACYQSICRGDQVSAEATLKPVYSYRDYVRWLAQQPKQQAREFWREKLADVEQVTALPLARIAPSPDQLASGDIQLAAMHHQKITLAHSQALKLQRLAQHSKTTVNVVIQAAWALLLAHYSGDKQVVFGSTTAGRPAQLAGVEKMLGLFINTLPLVIDIDMTQDLLSYLERLHTSMAEREQYNYLPLSEIQRLSGLKQPLFDTLMVFQNYPVDKDIEASGGEDGLIIRSVESFEQTNFAITFTAHMSEQLNIVLECKQQMFTQQAVAQIATGFRLLLEHMAEIIEPQRVALRSISIHSPAQQHYLLDELNDNGRAYEQTLLVHQLFEQQAAVTPNNVAVVYAPSGRPIVRLDYETLNARANRLARLLRNEGVKQGAFVGVCLARSADLVVSVLATLKAGGAYVPLDPSYPDARLQYMLDDSGLCYLLTNASSSDVFRQKGIAVFALDEPQFNARLAGLPAYNPDWDCGDSDGLAYMIYTSGSTGQPKGAMVTHRNVTNLLYWYKKQYAFDGTSGTLILSSMAFDLTQKNLFTPLICGAKVCLLPGEHLDRDLAIELIEQFDLSHLNCAPSAIYAVTDKGEYWPPLKYILLGGEPIEPAWVQRWVEYDGAKPALVNMYGPTECTDIACHFSLNEKWWQQHGLVPIGAANDNVQLYLLNDHQTLVPVGAIGELYIGGRGVGKGYFNKPELTDEKFVHLPHLGQHGQRLYRTGDLARYIESDNGQVVLEFVGRIDSQVKIRGFRVELGEIEHQLARHPDVDSCVIQIDDALGQKRLVAFVVGSSETKRLPQEQFELQLKQHLQKRLPEHMVPQHVVLMDTFPLTPNGKVDKKALVAPKAVMLATYQAPQNDDERLLCQIWAELLNIEPHRLSVNSNFFELGGDSILTIQVTSRAAKKGLYFGINDLFDAPTIKGLAQRLSHRNQVQSEQGLQSGYMPLLPIQRRFFSDLTDWHHFNQSLVLRVPNDFSNQALVSIISALVEHHDALRLRFDPVGPANKKWQSYFQVLDEHSIGRLVEAPEQVFSNISAWQRYADMQQASLDPSNGVLLKAVYGRFVPGVLPEGAQGCLLLIFHHLVVDGVSWRVLLEDIEQLYTHLIADEPLALAAKTSAYKQWATFLVDYAENDALNKQKLVWLERFKPESPRLEALPGNQPIDNHFSGGANASITLDKARTQALLGPCNGVYRTRINELLLAGLLLGLYRSCDLRTIRIDLESHGRGQLTRTLDVSRTVGWFTDIYPLTLQIEDDSIAGVICSVKEQYRSTPDEGISFGVLQQFSGDNAFANLPEREIIFNYLGQFGQVVNHQNHFAPLELPSGQEVSALRKPQHPLSFTGIINKDCLHFDLSYDKSRYRPQVIERLMAAFLEALELVVDHCLATQQGRFTPSDFPLATMDTTQLRQWHIEQQQGIEDVYPATGMQQGLLFHSLLQRGRYVTQTRLTFGPLQVQTFKQAWQKVCQRHVIFRTGFVGLDSHQPHQVVFRNVQLPWQEYDLSAMPATNVQARIEAIGLADKQQGFELTQAPLMRMSICRLPGEHYQLLWSYHHALVDGWSVPLIFAEVAQCYSALQRGEDVQLSSVYSYRDYVAWLGQQSRSEAQSYWREQLASVEQVTPVPLAVNRQVHGQIIDTSQSHQLILDCATTQALQELAAKAKVTFNVLLQAAWGLLLAKYNDNHIVTFGTTTSGRPAQLNGVEHMIGLFINTLPSVIAIDNDLSLALWLEKIHRQLVANELYSYLPLSDIQRLGDLKGSLFDSLLIFENYPVAMNETSTNREEALALLAVESVEGTNYGLTLIARKTEQLEIVFEVAEGLLSRSAIAQVSRHLQQLLSAFAAQSQPFDVTVGQLQMLGEGEVEQLLEQENHTEHSDMKALLVHECFEQQVHKTPKAYAVVLDNRAMSYQALDQAANQLAHYLKSQGVEQNTLVGLLYQRGPMMIIAMLAILKAGGGYVPLDPAYPSRRLQHIVEDSGLNYVLCQQQTASVLTLGKKVQCLVMDEPNRREALLQMPCVKLAPVDIQSVSAVANVIYTSGSTGTPKGVMITHRALVNHLTAMNCRLDGHLARCRMLAITTIAFDIAGLELFGPLMHGGTVVLTPQNVGLDPRVLTQWLLEHDIDCLQATPATWQLLVDSGWRGKSDLIALCGGEALNQTLALALTERSRVLWHCYGPTEATIWSMVKKLSYEQIQKQGVLLGNGLANYSHYVLDANLQLVPLGAEGELYIAGNSLALGYLNQPELSAERFIVSPFDKAQKLYRTGDKVVRLECGDVAYLGRTDHQIKIRGYRIELGEIESQLMGCHSVANAVVRPRQNAQGGHHLVAFIVAGDLDEQQDERWYSPLKRHLSETLPQYMVPQEFIRLSEMPLTANGKIDVHSLMDRQGDLGHSRYVAPRSALQQQVAQLWAELLDVAEHQVGITDSFFALGGHSLLILPLLSRLQQQCGLRLTMAQLYQNPTIEQLTEAELQTDSICRGRSIVPLSNGEANIQLFMFHPLGGRVDCYAEFAKALGDTVNVSGVQAPCFHHDAFRYDSIVELAQYYADAIVAKQPHGPYHLGGWSAGGVVACYVALELIARGESLDYLAIFDSPMVGQPQMAPDEALAIVAKFYLGKTTLAQMPLPAITDSTAQALVSSFTWLAEQLQRLDIDGFDSLPQNLMYIKAGFDFVKAERPALPTNLNVPVRLFSAAEREDVDALRQSWQQANRGPVYLERLDASHETMFEHPQSLAAMTAIVRQDIQTLQTVNQQHEQNRGND